jgi:drug/metabolite transporter (DMT)-like permease
LRLNPLGTLLGLLSGVSYATYIVLARYAQLRGADVLEVGFYSIPVALIGVAAIIHPRGPPTGTDVWFSLYLAILGTIIPYILNAAALRKIRAPLVSVISLVEPLTAVSLAVLLLNERMLPLQIIGSALVIGSVASSALHALRES